VVLQVGDLANGNGANLLCRAVLRPANGNAVTNERQRCVLGGSANGSWRDRPQEVSFIRQEVLFLFFKRWEGIFVTWSHQNDVVWMLPSTLTAKTNGGG
jgi:hypothetical protein